MRRSLQLLLLAALRLCAARIPAFSIHDDLLAFPQFEVVFSDGHISQQDADAQLQKRVHSPTPSTDDARHSDSAEAETSPGTASAFSYEIMKMTPNSYLCSIPILAPPQQLNHTANELAKQEEARELSRAVSTGWGLLSELENSCLFFMSGWWSYSFCHNREIVQFHAVAATVTGQPPRRDPQTAEYVLGRVPTIPATAEKYDYEGKASDDAPSVPAELQVKGQQRYLVQRLEGGTVCDLTGRPRTVEVQYHCVPGMKGTRIGWIKEVTICAYVMIVNTPRLCDDVAFLPPRDTKANAISCQLISDGNDAAPSLPSSETPAAQDDGSGAAATPGTVGPEGTAETKASNEAPVVVGGVVVGARKVLSRADEAGKPPVKLRGFWSSSGKQDRLIEVLVRAASKDDGGGVQVPTAEELKKLDIDPKIVDEMKSKMAEMAGDAGWKLEVVETVGGDFRELRGIIDGEETKSEADVQEAGGGDGGEGRGETDGKAGTKEKGAGKAGARDEEKKRASKSNRGKKAKDGDIGGSEEQFYKDEL